MSHAIAIASLCPSLFGTFPNVVAWYRADVGIVKTGANITGWQDQGPNGYTLSNALTAYPALVSSAIGGQPALQFATSPMASAAFAISGPFTSICVCQVDALASIECAWSFTGATAGYLYSNAGPDATLNWNAAQFNTSYNLTNASIVTAIANGASSSLQVNGSKTTGALGTGGSTTGLVVGALNLIGGDPWGKYISELVFFSGAAVPNGFNSYLQSRYGITP